MYERNVIKIKLDKGAIAPTRGHTWDAGMDLYAHKDCVIPPAICTGDTWRAADAELYDCVKVGSMVIDTGVHLGIPEGYYGEVRSRSGLMVNHGITTDGTIDAHYTGPIKVCLFNHCGSEYRVKAGDKIAQLVIVPCVLPRLELVDSLEETDRGDNGFGSTGR